jgi:hypothetical protein
VAGLVPARLTLQTWSCRNVRARFPGPRINYGVVSSAHRSTRAGPLRREETPRHFQQLRAERRESSGLRRDTSPPSSCGLRRPNLPGPIPQQTDAAPDLRWPCFSRSLPAIRPADGGLQRHVAVSAAEHDDRGVIGWAGGRPTELASAARGQDPDRPRATSSGGVRLVEIFSPVTIPPHHPLVKRFGASATPGAQPQSGQTGSAGNPRSDPRMRAPSERGVGDVNVRCAGTGAAIVSAGSARGRPPSPDRTGSHRARGGPAAFRRSARAWRRLFAEVLGTFFLVLAGAGARVVDAVSHGHIGRGATVAAPGRAGR